MTVSAKGDRDLHNDEHFMQLALDEARYGEGFVEPNPMVGCLLVREGKVIGRGHHRKFGGPHAEVMALRSLDSTQDARGATAYVTLEPCCHHGKTPPCADALIGAGVARVVVAMQDPFPKVDGGGLQRLHDAGIETTLGVLVDEAAEVVAPFVKHVRTGKPWVIAKWAMTLDGKIATTTGESQWITGDASREEVHRLRGRVDAVIAGMGTITADDPQLTSRPPGPRSQTRVVFCRNRLPGLNSRLMQTIDQSPVTLIVSDLIDQEKARSLVTRGARLLSLATSDAIEMVTESLLMMGDQQMTNVMVEGGGELLGSFVRARAVDECHVYIGAKVFGGLSALGPVGGQGIGPLVDALQLRRISVESFGQDVRLVYRTSSPECSR